MARRIVTSLLALALAAQPAFPSCRGNSSVVYPRATSTPGLIRTGGFHPRWLDQKLHWSSQPLLWDQLSRYFGGETAVPARPGLLHPDTGEIYDSIEAMPRLSSWTSDLLQVQYFARYFADGRIVGYGIFGAHTGLNCGPKPKHWRNTYVYDRKRGHNYCTQLRKHPLRSPDEEAPPPTTAAQGVCGCAEYSGPAMGYWEVSSDIPSVYLSDQDGDGVFERLDFLQRAPTPAWAAPFAKQNRYIRTDPLAAQRLRGLDGALLEPHTRVVLATK